MISSHHDNLLIGHFGIDITEILIIRIYYWSIFCYDIKTYVKDYDIYLAFKAVCYKTYRDLQLFLILTYY